MSAGDVYKAAVLWAVGGVDDPEVNVFHYRQGEDQVKPTPSEDLATALYEDALQAVADCISDAIQTSTIQVRGVTTPTEGGDFTFDPAIVGGLSGQTYALQIAQLISWSTGLIGRHYKGRNFLPPPTEDVINGAGSISSGQLTLLNSAALALVHIDATGTHGEWLLCIHSKPDPDADPPWAGADTNVTSWAIRDRVKTQRRRGI